MCTSISDGIGVRTVGSLQSANMRGSGAETYGDTGPKNWGRVSVWCWWEWETVGVWGASTAWADFGVWAAVGVVELRPGR